MRSLFKHFFFQLIFLVVPYGLFCQIEFRDSAEIYKYWAQRGIMEMIYASMEDYPKELREEEKKGKQLYHDQYIRGIDKKAILEIGQTFQETEQFLIKNSYGNTAKNIFLPLKQAYEQHKRFDEQFFKVPNYYENSQNWDKIKTNLLAAYSNSLNRLTPPGETSQKPVKMAENIPNDTTVEESFRVWFWILIGFFGGLITGALFVFQYSKSKTYSLLASEKYKYLDKLKQDTRRNLILRKYFKYLGIIAVLKHSKDLKKEELGRLTKEINQLKVENKELKKENQQKNEVITDPIIVADKINLHFSIGNEQLDQNDKLNDDILELFFTIPEPDGSFKIVNARNYKQIDCLYKIIMSKGGQRGTLHFISGEYDLIAMDNIDYYLNPVCEIQNIMDRKDARRIRMIDTGSVIKRGDYWNIDENNKVKIELLK